VTSLNICVPVARKSVELCDQSKICVPIVRKSVELGDRSNNHLRTGSPEVKGIQ
jgi:hypothetical protein